MGTNTSADNELLYKSNSFIGHVFKGLEEAYQGGEFCDISVDLGRQSFRCHRVILAAVRRGRRKALWRRGSEPRGREWRRQP